MRDSLSRHLDLVRAQHDRDLKGGAGWVELPGALVRKYPGLQPFVARVHS